MLNKAMLKAMPPRTIFATGTAIDEPDGLLMARTGKELRWVAVRGGAHDWTIYCHLADKDIGWISRHGDKVCGEEHIKKLVPCDDEAYKLFRR